MWQFVVVYPSIAVGFLLVLALMVRWFAVRSDQKRTEYLLVFTMFAVVLSSIAQAIANNLTRLRPMKYDLYVYRIDSFFGQPSFVLGRMVAENTALKILVSISYGILPMVIVAVFATYLYLRSGTETVATLRVFLVNLIAAVPLYLIYPVCGPQMAFAEFPEQPTFPPAPHLLGIASAPNGVPSVHMSSALLILWLLRRWTWGRLAGGVFAALTVLATLGSGQHYFFDLLCAIPYAAAVYWIAWGKTSRVPAKEVAPVNHQEAAFSTE